MDNSIHKNSIPNITVIDSIEIVNVTNSEPAMDSEQIPTKPMN